MWRDRPHPAGPREGQPTGRGCAGGLTDGLCGPHELRRLPQSHSDHIWLCINLEAVAVYRTGSAYERATCDKTRLSLEASENHGSASATCARSKVVL